MDGSSVPHFESENGLKKQSRDRGKPPLQRAELAFLATTDLKPDPRNPRKHDRRQIRAIDSVSCCAPPMMLVAAQHRPPLPST